MKTAWSAEVAPTPRLVGVFVDMMIGDPLLSMPPREFISNFCVSLLIVKSTNSSAVSSPLKKLGFASELTPPPPPDMIHVIVSATAEDQTISLKWRGSKI